MVGASSKTSGVHDASSFDLEFSRGGLSEGLFCLLALGEDLVVDGLVCLEGEKGVAHLSRNYYRRYSLLWMYSQSLKNLRS